MTPKARSHATPSTQYARNGPLLPESLEFTRLISKCVTRAERKRILVSENRLGRHTYKSRRNIFEALEARFADHRRAANLGFLSMTTGLSRSFAMGCFLELAKHDALVGSFVRYSIEAMGSGSATDAASFLGQLDVGSGSVNAWSPTLRRRAIASLNAISHKFQVTDGLPPAVRGELRFPVELAAIIFQERLEDNLSAVGAPEFALLNLSRNAVVALLWSCARREWFRVDIIGDVVNVERRFENAASLLQISSGGEILA